MGNTHPIYVLRGSKVKPTADLESARLRYEKAEREWNEARETLVAATEAHKQTLTQTDTEDLSKRDLIQLINTLHTRIENLESKHQASVTAATQSDEAWMRTLKQLTCGGLAGATARTCVAPLDRVKILMQTQFVSFGGEKKYNSIPQTLRKIFVEEGVTRLWRGNATNIVRVVPYSATQFASYDYYKRMLFGDSNLTPQQRLMAGALAGTTATSITHPLDVIRLRLNTQPELKGAVDAAMSVWKEGGIRECFKGYVPTVLSLAPFIAINFASFDMLKKAVYPHPDMEQGTLTILGLGATAGLFAQSICYPLDTVRRRMQMKGQTYKGTIDAFRTIAAKESLRGFYKGMFANAVKVMPNNSIRFLAYEFFKKQLGVEGKRKR